MVIKVYPRTVFEIIKGTLTEQKLLDSSKVISINTPVYAPKNITKEEPPFTLLNHPNLLILFLFYIFMIITNRFKMLF